jgi:hypothetical protein
VGDSAHPPPAGHMIRHDRRHLRHRATLAVAATLGTSQTAPFRAASCYPPTHDEVRHGSVRPQVWAGTGLAPAQTCDLAFTVILTQGAGPLRPGDELEGEATFTAIGESFRQEGGSTAHLASGEMRIGDTDLGAYLDAHHHVRGAVLRPHRRLCPPCRGLSVAGIDFSGPMALTLFGPSGSRPDPNPPTRRRTGTAWTCAAPSRFQAPEGRDILTGDVTEVLVNCE